MTQVVLVFHMWNARRKARQVAEAETCQLLRDLNPQVLAGGPLSEVKGIFWIAIPQENLEIARTRFPRLGYTQFVDMPMVVPDGELPADPSRAVRRRELVRWRNQYHRLDRVYEADSQAMLDSAPDRREFMLRYAGGGIRPVKGYRGDGNTLSRRGLPPHDARLLVNLVRPGTPDTVFLDPFAGVGGVVLEAIASGYQVLSADIDPFLMDGLSHFGARHCIADAARLPFAGAAIDGIATEPPYDRITAKLVQPWLAEMTRVLKTGARLAVFCASWQADGFRRGSQSLGLECYLDEAVNRKGTDCVVLAWVKK
jgi:SAM-dependent methyltransferase